MKRKLIEKIPWQSKGEKKILMAAAAIHEVAGEKILIVDFSVDNPVMRIALSQSDFENYFPDETICKRAPKWGRMLYQNIRGESYFLSLWTYENVEKKIDDESARVIHEFVYGKKDTYQTHWEYDIDYLQNQINYEKRETADHRRKQRINEKMATVPEPTEAFKKWAESFVDIHIIRMLPFRKKAVTQAICSACGREHEYKRGMIRANTVIKCPSCGAVCTVRRVDYKNQNPLPCYRFQKEVILFQRIGDEFCERHFEAYKKIDINAEKMDLTEIGRIFHDIGYRFQDIDHKSHGKKDKTYFHKYNPWDGSTFWDDKNLDGMSSIVLKSGPVYPRTINTRLFTGTRYQYCAMDRIKAEKGFTPIAYLNKYDQMPQVMEMMVKMGLYRMALEISPYAFSGDGKPWEQLGISKNHLNRLRKINGGCKALAWMRNEKGTGRVIDDDTIIFFEKEDISPGDIDFIMDRMSERQVMNYIVRQRKQRRSSIEDILRLWEDYLSMALRMKMDVEKELIYKPKDVKQAHDELVRLCGGVDVAKRAGEIVQKFPDVETIMQAIKKKFEYGDDTYTVVVPARIEDIIYEGRTLGHCLDKSDIYFDRIQRKESFIVFLRKTDDIEKPYYTLEVEPDGTARQKRTTGDRQDKDFQEVVSFIRKWQREVRKRIDKADKELAAQSAKLREAEFRELRKNQTKVWHGALAGKLLADVLEADLMIANG